MQPGTLRVATYGGVRDALSAGWRQPARLAALQPSRLSECDLLLCSFETLRAELVHTDDALGEDGGGGTGAGGRSLRGGTGVGGKGSGGARGTTAQQLRSPLLALRWWRVILDEAQMVECSTAKAAAMARQLETTHRWAVSGTPLGRGKWADLFGLMSFLRLEPWAERAWWQHAIEAPLGALQQLAGGEGTGAAAGSSAPSPLPRSSDVSTTAANVSSSAGEASSEASSSSVVPQSAGTVSAAPTTPPRNGSGSGKAAANRAATAALASAAAAAAAATAARCCD